MNQIQDVSLAKAKRKNSIREYLRTIKDLPSGKNNTEVLIKSHQAQLDIIVRYAEWHYTAQFRMRFLPKKLRNWLMGY